jgi:hypothetical protein
MDKSVRKEAIFYTFRRTVIERKSMGYQSVAEFVGEIRERGGCILQNRKGPGISHGDIA